MNETRRLLAELTQHSADAVSAARAGDADQATRALEARDGVLSALPRVLAKASPSDREEAQRVAGETLSSDRELERLLVALRDQTRQALEATRTARAASDNAELTPPPARFVSQRA